MPKLIDLVIRKALSLRHGQDFFPDKVVFFQQSVYSKVRDMVFWDFPLLDQVFVEHRHGHGGMFFS
ncbi:hypothetical protein B9L23_11185 [Parageobacillus galactosidasius]|uniref:Uncharacterized protein n=1 Tax=Parageobacillus galactosidasius TaxID=883812 RepID=A0A226QGV8_9BACL|nr:hypothetical protein B9L23_11185 [Parageobacillus galactosidasius]